jgi:hypothetical protein
MGWENDGKELQSADTAGCELVAGFLGSGSAEAGAADGAAEVLATHFDDDAHFGEA